MKRIAKSALALLLVLLMVLETGGAGAAFALEELDKALRPAEHVELTVPERFRDGGSWFFIPEQGYAVSERSGERIYIPIQRTGDLEAEAEVILKVTDISARHDVNYSVELYRDDTEPVIRLDDQAIVDIILNADGQEEYEPIADEAELGALIHATGGADIVDEDGRVLGTVTVTTDADETPAEEAEAPAAESESDEAPAAESESDEAPAAESESDKAPTAEPEPADAPALSATEALRAARTAYTGDVSDRQELSGGDLTDFNAVQAPNAMSEEEYDREMADLAVEDYPGKEYSLRFAAGEAAKFLVITPLYSEAAEGDAQLMLTLKEPSEGYAIGEDVNPVSVTIYDEDAPEPVTVSMAEQTVYAENGKALVTVTRAGRVNAIKGVTLASWDGSAREGDEYSGVGAKLYFPVGITSRTVEIPVYHGSEEKDFYVSITALDDEEIGVSTTRVVIPAAETEGALMNAADGQSRTGRPVTDPINLRAGWFDRGGFNSDTAFWLSTSSNKEETSHFWLSTSGYGSAYDGMYLEYNGYLSWCDGEFRYVRYVGGSGVRDHVNYFDEGGVKNGHWLYAAWNAVKAPDKISIEAADVDVEGPVGTSSYISMWVNGVYLIKRQFTVAVESAEVRPLIGVSDADVLRDYEAVFLDGQQKASRTLWTDDSFSVSIKNEKGPLRLVGLEAKDADGKWVRIASVNGTSQLVNVTMNAGTINALADQGCIAWTQNGSINGRTSYRGSLTIRPAFDYFDAAVELKGHDYGSLSADAPTPNLLWDFNSDLSMDRRMGISSLYPTRQVSWSGWKEGTDEAYLFTASGKDPYVPIGTPVTSLSEIRYVKVRAKNLNDADKIELFVSNNNAGLKGDGYIGIPLASDTEWHEYVIDVTQAQGYHAERWDGYLSWFRLDPMAGNTRSGSAILIDYIAFFSTEDSARAYRADGFAAAPGVYSYHLGDRLSFQTAVSGAGSAANMKTDGVSYELRKHSETGSMTDWIDAHYLNGSVTVMLSGRTLGDRIVDEPHYTFKPTFTEQGNSVTVEVSKAALEYLDTTKGIFKSFVSREESGDAWIYTLQENVRSNVPVELNACEKTPNTAMPCWIMSSGAQYWGSSASFRTGERAVSNRVKLQVYVYGAASLLSDEGDGEGELLDAPVFGPTYAAVSGTVASATFNLSTGRSAADLVPAQYAYVSCGDVGTWTDEEGHFELPAIFTMGGGQVCCTVTYNGAVSIHSVPVPAPTAPKSEKLTLDSIPVQAVTANAGVLRVESFSETGAHFVSAYAAQDDILAGTVNGLIMNGKSMTIQVQVAQGADYLLNGEPRSEQVTDVTLFFMDQNTGEVHGSYSSNTTPSENAPAQWSYNGETGLFTLRINQFDPAHPTEWTYGDVLMAQLTTDKKAALTAWDESIPMRYEPVSTGIAVYADPSYEPQTFDFDLENLPAMLGIEPQTDEEGNLLDDDTRYSFGAFPYIGEITAAIHVFSRVVSSATASSEMDALMDDLSDLALDDDEAGYGEFGDGKNTGSGGGETKNYTLNVLVKIDETVYGGVRFMFGIVVTGGGGDGYKRQRNPFHNVNNLIASYQYNAKYNSLADATDLIVDATSPKSLGSSKKTISDFGGAYFTFSVFVGFYLDYGYIEISTANGAEKSHDMVYMGAGGFIGFSGSVGYTWAFMAGPVPMYINVDAGLSITFFFGSEGNPQKTLQSFKTDPELHGQDFHFNFEFKGRIYVSGTIGIGWYKILGARVTVEVAFEAGYGLNITDWYPNLFDSGWGYVTEATFTGTLDLILTSIDFYSATWPLPLADGFLYYFQEVRRANRCISYVETGIQKGEGSAAARATAQSMANELKRMVDTNELLSAVGPEEAPVLADVETIRELTYALKDYAYDHDIINWTTKNTIEMNKQGGIVGAIINATTEDDAGTGLRFHTNDHVEPQWVANDGQLMAAFGNARSQVLAEDAYAQPSSKLLALGGGRYLLVFLSDSADRDRMTASTLTWTVYDEGTGLWTEPQAVAEGCVADSRPELTDAGERIVLSWASIPEEQYDALKNSFREELTERLGGPVSEETVLEAMEADPARVMSAYEVYSVEFDKSGERFETPTRLTFDGYYDDYPQAVYDEESGDYLVMYYKTAQDDEDYDNAGDKLQDIIGASPDPEKTYGVVCYMIYNAAADPDAGCLDDSGERHTVPAGWVTEHLYAGELNAESLAAYGGTAYYLETWRGQRFMPSAVRNADGSYADPPITDLTVAPGTDGVATYAFTVDRDFNLNTAEDRELYLEFYRFETHSVSVPVRVAGERSVSSEIYDALSDSFVTQTSTKQVEVGTPRLVRNGGSSFLFWREGGDSLRYLNVTELLEARVAAVAEPGEDESDWTRAVRPDGSFAVDAATGETYQPRAEKLELASQLTGDAIEITDYEVITDADDNLYVVWTDTVTSDVTNDAGETWPVTAQELFASAMLRQEEVTETCADDEGISTVNSATCRWSKPYRLTRDNAFNDGLALALDGNGGLMIVHNQYSKTYARSEAELYRLIDEGRIGLTRDREGNLYAASLSYNSPVSLVLTRLDKVGSVEATQFSFSDEHPAAGQIITVTAALENVGLTDAEGCRVEFYEYRDGARGEKLCGFTSDETIPVNTAKSVSFRWKVPAEGAEGVSILAVIREKNGGGWYDAVESRSEPFKAEPVYQLRIHEITQEGDSFLIDYELCNTGNAPAPEGSRAALRLVGLYGNLSSARYGGLETGELYSAALTLPAKTAEASAVYAATEEGDAERESSEVTDASFGERVSVSIPVSVFRYCGYDALQLVVIDRSGGVLAESDQHLIRLTAPMNLSLNGGETLRLGRDGTADTALSYDSTVFIEKGTVVYSVDDPAVASVDANGTVAAVGNGTTTLTATLLPYGLSESIRVQVSGYSNGTPDTPVTPDTPTPTEQPEPTPCDGGERCPLSAFKDLNSAAWYHDGVHWALENGVMQGVETDSFAPNGTTTRAMLVTMLYRLEGEPETDYEMRFTDVEAGKWYTEAIRWAAANEIVKGYSEERFGPKNELTREQLAAILYRYAQTKGRGFRGLWSFLLDYDDADQVSDWAYEAVCWMTMQGVIQGTGERVLSPKSSAARAQVATMLARYEQLA